MLRPPPETAPETAHFPRSRCNNVNFLLNNKAVNTVLRSFGTVRSLVVGAYAEASDRTGW